MNPALTVTSQYYATNCFRHKCVCVVGTVRFYGFCCVNSQSVWENVRQGWVSAGSPCSAPWRGASSRSDQPALAAGAEPSAASSPPGPPAPEPGTSSGTCKTVRQG